MSATDRQNRLLVAEDWKKIYQSFKNADFQSYDFENLRRTMVDYIRQNYPEDFNDYIESSEYLALIDVIAFLGQSISFRVDLNARENFFELAERRDSVLKLARLVSYNAKRNIPGNGLLKFTSIATTQSVIDSNGRNLAGQIVTWNDSSNSNWYDQFIKIMNASMSANQQFGNPSDKGTVYSVMTERYTIETTSTDVPVFSFSKTVSGRIMNFEITSTTFTGQNYIYEESPKAGRKLSCIFKNDGQGYGSSGTGFFLNFTQGTLTNQQFTLTQPRSNEIVNVNTTGINNSDVWLYRLDKDGKESEEWTQVSNFEGNNIIYNSVSKNIRNIYSVVTRANDAVSLNFSDGTFGNKPLGTFKVYYRTSNGISYVINPKDIRNVTITVPYLTNVGKQETLTVSLSLESTVSTADAAETNANIKANAPANYYTQNRMITGEDYNICPLSINQQILKVKAINRSSSGVSRYFDLVDPTGKYSSTNLFANDGVIFTENYQTTNKFTYLSRTDIQGVIANVVNKILKKVELRDFYYAHYTSEFRKATNNEYIWSLHNNTAGCIKTTNESILAVGVAAINNALLLYYIKSGALLKFVAPAGKYFDRTNQNKLITVPANTDIADIIGATDYIWASVVSVAGSGDSILGNGITLNISIPAGAIVYQIIPQFRTILESSIVTTITDLIFENKEFGLSYDTSIQQWKIIRESNLDYTSAFSLLAQGDISNKQQDSSWMILFTTDTESYTISSRETRYIFESDKELRFYYDKSQAVYDSISNSSVRDKVIILSINTSISTKPYTTDFVWDVVSEYVGLDGYVDNKKIVISFADTNNDGVVDNPEMFKQLLDLDPYVVQERYSISTGQDDYRYIKNTGIVTMVTSETSINPEVGKYYYYTDTNILKKAIINNLEISSDYKVYAGRRNLKFQYTHNARYDSRIDPGSSNIIDVFVLIKSYDTSYRQWVSGAISTKPLPPSSNELYNMIAPSLNLIKSISDEVIYHPVKYKILFGSTAAPELQATFKITKTPGQVLSDNDVKSQVILAINNFFVLDNWDFGDTFFFTELAAYVTTTVSPAISSFVIVPRHNSINFGALFEIKSAMDEILINGATVNDIEIISGITASNIRSSNLTTSTNTINQQFIKSTVTGSN